jgi:hypothetical protein
MNSNVAAIRKVHALLDTVYAPPGTLVSRVARAISQINALRGLLDEASDFRRLLQGKLSQLSAEKRNLESCNATQYNWLKAIQQVIKQHTDGSNTDLHPANFAATVAAMSHASREAVSSATELSNVDNTLRHIAAQNPEVLARWKQCLPQNASRHQRVLEMALQISALTAALRLTRQANDAARTTDAARVGALSRALRHLLVDPTSRIARDTAVRALQEHGTDNYGETFGATGGRQ